MSGFIKPNDDVIKALDMVLPELKRTTMTDRPTSRSQYGRSLKAKKSDDGDKFQEKQKIRNHYALTEGQLRRLVQDARRSKQTVGESLMQLIERRLENIVFRAGFAPTIPAARQL